MMSIIFVMGVDDLLYIPQTNATRLRMNWMARKMANRTCLTRPFAILDSVDDQKWRKWDVGIIGL